MARRGLTAENMGLKLRELREKRRLSMRELAGRADVSVSFVSKVEAGKICPTVMFLQKLLEALDIGLHEFFHDGVNGDPSDQIVFKKSQMAFSEDKDRRWYYAFPKHPDIKLELTYEEYQPHTQVVEKESHKGDIGGYVVAGQLTLEVNGRGTFTVRAGDAFYVKAGQLHSGRNDSDRPLKLVCSQVL